MLAQIEEMAFDFLFYIMFVRNWRTVFMEGFPGYYTKMAKLESRLKTHLPEIDKKFEELKQAQILEMGETVMILIRFYLIECGD